MIFLGVEKELSSGENALRRALKLNRISHAIVLEDKDGEGFDGELEYICKWAVCRENDRPCGRCAQCRKAESLSHPDIYTAQLSGKTAAVNVEEVRKICADAYIRPNEAANKVYIIKNADRMQIQAQNALLKLIEEPPQNILFVLCCERKDRLLPTILSRVTVYNLDSAEEEDKSCDEIYAEAERIALAITESKGYNLLLSLKDLKDREHTGKVIRSLKGIITNALKAKTAGIKCSEAERKLCEKTDIINLINITDTLDTALQRLGSNINMNLFSTWLCSEIRRKK